MAVFGKFEGIREQVLEDLFQTLTVGFQLVVADGGQIDVQLQVFLVGNGLEHLSQITGDTLYRYGFGARLNVSGLDLGQVQNIVDQIQQIVTRRLDCQGIGNLLLAQVTVSIVGQQFREDQQGIERRPQFVGHIGQEVRLVLAGLFQLAGLENQFGSVTFQFVALGLQRIGLFFQLAVGLFQFGLLLFQTNLGFLQRMALFLQLLVGDAKFFALDLKLFGLTLGFFQHVLQTNTILGRPQRSADCRTGFFQQCNNAFIHGMKIAQFKHDIDFAAGLTRCNQQVARVVASKGRTDGQIAVGYIIQQDGFSFTGDLTQQAFAMGEPVRYCGVSRNAQHGDASVMVILAAEKRTGMCARVLAEE